MWGQVVLIQPNPHQYSPVRCSGLLGLGWSGPTPMRGELDWVGPIQISSVLSCPAEFASEQAEPDQTSPVQPSPIQSNHWIE
eukprot:231389-Lingulodinium_polyedra.AAC.1